MAKLIKYEKSVPDGGWGWVVCVASFLIQMISDGTTRAFGILLVDFLQYFHSRESSTAWIGSLQPALMYISGFMATPFLHCFGYRAVAIFGAILSGIGFGTSALATNIYILYFTYGVCTGIGNGLMYITSVVAVQQYFSTKRGIANGIAVSGSAFGIVLFGLGTPFLVAGIGWQITVLVFSCLTIVIGIVCGSLYKPLYYTSFTGVKQQTAVPVQRSNHEDGDIDSAYKQLELTRSIYEQKSFHYGSLEDSYEIIESVPVRKSCPILSTVPELVNDDIICDFEFMEFPITTESKRPDKLRKHFHHISHTKQFVAVTKKTFNFQLLKNPVFILFSFNMFMFTFSLSVSYAFLPLWAVSMDAPYEVGSLLIPVIGLTSIFTRLGFGIVADRNPKNRFVITGCLFTFMAILGLLCACFMNYPSLFVYATCFGLITGGITTMYPVILFDLVGRKDFDKALGLNMAITSIACLTGAPIAGAMIQAKPGKIHGAFIPFMIVGGVQVLGVISYFLIAFFKSKNDKQTIMDTETNLLAKTENKENLLSEESVSKLIEYEVEGNANGKSNHKAARESSSLLTSPNVSKTEYSDMPQNNMPSSADISSSEDEVDDYILKASKEKRLPDINL